MASCKAGHVYIVYTGITKPPKAKFAICVCIDPGYFVWISTKAAPHAQDQLPIPAGCHDLIEHDSHIDLSQIVFHQPREVEGAKEFPMLSEELVRSMIEKIDAGLERMSPRHAAIVREALAALYP